MRTRIAAALLITATAAACGTEVKVGANEDKARELQRRAVDGAPGTGSGDAEVYSDGGAADGVVDSGGGGDPDGGAAGDGTPSGGAGTGAAALTCFGPAPAFPAGFEQFCAIDDTVLRAQFASSFATICDQKRLMNLLLAPCSWTGEGASDKYRRVLDKTPLDDQTSKDFHFLAAYALTTDDSVEDQVALVKRELTDPDYAKTFVIIKNSKIYDLAQNPDGTYDYTAELANSSATVKFRAHVVFVDLSPDLTVEFDYAVSDQVIVKEHHFLRFVSRLGPATSRVIGIEEKVVTDGGNHVLAYQNLTDVVKQRQERDYENARRD